MAKRTTSSRTKPAEGELPRPELAALRPLVRRLAQEAARETWAALQAKELTSHDQQEDQQ